MRDVILAAAGAAADATVVPAPEPAQPTEASETAVLREVAARTAGETEGIKTGSAAERARIKSIIGSDQAKGREDLAHYFAFDTDMAAEMVVAALSKSPVAKSQLDSAMTREVQPKLGVGGDRAEVLPRVISAEEVYARRRAAVATALKR